MSNGIAVQTSTVSSGAQTCGSFEWGALKLPNSSLIDQSDGAQSSVVGIVAPDSSKTLYGSPSTDGRYKSVYQIKLDKEAELAFDISLADRSRYPYIRVSADVTKSETKDFSVFKERTEDGKVLVTLAFYQQAEGVVKANGETMKLSQAVTEVRPNEPIKPVETLKPPTVLPQLTLQSASPTEVTAPRRSEADIEEISTLKNELRAMQMRFEALSLEVERERAERVAKSAGDTKLGETQTFEKMKDPPVGGIPSNPSSGTLAVVHDLPEVLPNPKPLKDAEVKPESESKLVSVESLEDQELALRMQKYASLREAMAKEGDRMLRLEGYGEGQHYVEGSHKLIPAKPGYGPGHDFGLCANFRHKSDSAWWIDPRTTIGLEQKTKAIGGDDDLHFVWTIKDKNSWSPVGGYTNGQGRHRWGYNHHGWKVHNDILDKFEALEHRVKAAWAKQQAANKV